jgi:hypothetical protein
MRSHADRTGRGLVCIQMVVNNSCDCQPDGQQQAQPTYNLADRPHSVPHNDAENLH